MRFLFCTIFFIFCISSNSFAAGLLCFSNNDCPGGKVCLGARSVFTCMDNPQNPSCATCMTTKANSDISIGSQYYNLNCLQTVTISDNAGTPRYGVCQVNVIIEQVCYAYRTLRDTLGRYTVLFALFFLGVNYMFGNTKPGQGMATGAIQIVVAAVCIYSGMQILFMVLKVTDANTCSPKYINTVLKSNSIK
ncbi:hypothetical protein [Candidatus Deianiraea vastatrix]|uniref:TM2 domain-containing protein n=1 Tax=Candidatus Deianiraea vastatrix TaxID=2163644 RepID=A0A5B8XH79_9RICK|nr:hypothetical protein [Candidatus Deianiraea vastatrix]QED23471.1 hypothetical protein Deia_00679 [Candidatus Deianiraea vastatrix]